MSNISKVTLVKPITVTTKIIVAGKIKGQVPKMENPPPPPSKKK